MRNLKFVLGLLLTILLALGFSQNQYFLEYDGVDDYVRLDDNSTLDRLNSQSEYTLECWIYINSWNDNMAIFSRWSRFIFYLRTNGQLALFVNTSNGWYRNYSVNNAVPTNEWVHVAAIRSSSNGIKFYVNGVDKSAGTYNGYSMLGNSDDDNLYIAYSGNLTNTSQEGDVNFVRFNGWIDEVRCKKGAEDPANLHYHKNDPEYVSDANTAALFHFDEGSGSVTADEASGLNARLGSTTVGDAAEPTWRPWNYNGSDLSLPVELTSFTASVEDGAVQLNWVTESEVNNQGFEIWRALEKEGTYQRIADYTTHPELKGQGNSTLRHEYRYTDQTVTSGHVYWYKLADVDVTGKRTFHGPISVSIYQGNLTTISSNIPRTVHLYPNFPNPFNPSTTLKFDIPLLTEGPAEVQLAIYNSLGQKVATLFHGFLNAGTYQVQWDGKDARGNKVQSGIYFAMLQTGFNTRTIKLVLMK